MGCRFAWDVGAAGISPRGAVRGGKGLGCLRADAQSQEQQPLLHRRAHGSWEERPLCTTVSLTLDVQLFGGHLSFAEVRLTFAKTYFTIISHTHLVP